MTDKNEIRWDTLISEDFRQLLEDNLHFSEYNSVVSTTTTKFTVIKASAFKAPPIGLFVGSQD
jgi:hypothetical protein